MTRLAIVDHSGLVVTFVRADAPPGWQPPEGCTAVPEEQLPRGWRMAEQEPVPAPEPAAAVTSEQVVTLMDSLRDSLGLPTGAVAAALRDADIVAK